MRDTSRGVTRARPVVRDNLAASRAPVLIARQGEEEKRAPCHSAPVTHSCAALAFWTGGRLRVELNGEWKVREGDVLLVPAGEPHRLLERQGTRCGKLSFCVSCFAADAAMSLLDPFERVRDGGSDVSTRARRHPCRMARRSNTLKRAFHVKSRPTSRAPS